MTGGMEQRRRALKVSEALVEKLKDAAGEMCLGSDYALLLVGLARHHVYQELKRQEGWEMEKGDEAWLQVPIPYGDAELVMLPVNVDRYRRVFHLPPGVNLDWRAEREALERHFLASEDFYRNKKSLMMMKILGLAQEFPTRLQALANQFHLPLVVVARIFLVITLCPPDLKSASPPAIHLPSTVIDGAQETFLRGVNQAILDLLYETLGVLVTIAQIETLRFAGILAGAPCEVGSLKTFLKEDLCFPNPKFESWLSGELTVKQILRLIEWKLEGYRFAYAFVQEFKHYVRFRAESLAFKKSFLLKEPVKSAEKFFSGKKDNFLGDGLNISSTSQGNTGSVYSNIDTYFYEIINIFIDKMDGGLIYNYVIMGSPYNLLAYIKKTVENIARTILLNEYNNTLKAEYSISYKTLKGYKQKGLLKYGEENLSEDSNYEKYYNAKAEIAEIQHKMSLKQKHRREGFLTQRQLVNFLQDKNVIEQFNRAGVPLKKQSERIIRGKLAKLLQYGRIPFEKTPQAILYAETDIERIVSELARIQQN